MQSQAQGSGDGMSKSMIVYTADGGCRQVILSFKVCMAVVVEALDIGVGLYQKRLRC